MPSIIRAFVPYVVTCLMFTALVALRVAGGFAATQIPLDQIPLKIAATVLMSFVSLYLLTVEMRVLGTLFRCYRDRLCWLRPAVEFIGQEFSNHFLTFSSQNLTP